LKALRIGGLVLAALLVLGAGVFAWAVYSESGARSLLTLSRRWLPAGLTVGEVRGTVAGRLRIRNLRYRDPTAGMDLTIDDAVLEFAAMALLSRRLHVERAQVDGVRLALFTATPSGPPATPRDPWAAPLDMQVDELRLTRGELQRTDAAPFVVRKLNLAASWIGSDIVARSLELDSPAGQLTLSARVAPPLPRLKELKARVRWRIGEREWAGTLDARGAHASLELAAALESPVSMNIAATLAGRMADGERSLWRAHVSVPRFDPHPLLDSDAFETLSLELDAEGDLDALALRGSLSVDQDRVHIESLNLVRRERLLEIAALRMRLNAQPAALTGRGAEDAPQCAAGGAHRTCAFVARCFATLLRRAGLGRVPLAGGLGRGEFSLFGQTRADHITAALRLERHGATGARRKKLHACIARRRLERAAAH
jgi:translocation and assembly module TamB